MRISFPILTACLGLLLVLPGRAQSASSDSTFLTNIEDCLENVRGRSNAICPFQVRATVTLLDKERGVFFLQDATAAMGVCLPVTNSYFASLRPGQSISLQGTGVLPYIRSFPDYPERPSGSEYVTSFEAPSGAGTYYLTRMRGFLRPPVTGQYTFWIAADDAGEFWLSPDADPAKAKRVCGTFSATGRREWDRYSTQRSPPVELKAGEQYYVEALQMQGVGPDCLAIAWQGPDMPMSVIDGRYLSPWAKPADEADVPPDMVSPTNCILREHWDNYFVRNFFPLHYRSPRESIVRVRAPKLKVLGEGALPEPNLVSPGAAPERTNWYRWSKIEGTVSFAGASDEGLRLQVEVDKSDMNVVVFNWPGGATERLKHSRVRIQGVAEPAVDSRGRPSGSILWVPNPSYLTVLPPAENDWSDIDSVFLSEVESSNPSMTWGRRIKVRGRVTQQDSGNALRLQGNDIFEGFLSRDGTNWTQIGGPIEIGMSNSALIGLAVASRQVADLATATFDDLKIPETNWLDATIDNPDRTGRYQFTNASYTIVGAGKRILSAADQCYFLYQPLEGEGEIVARLASFTSPDRMGQAGLMVRESLDRGSTCAAMLITPAHGARFQCRKTPGDYTVQFDPPSDVVDYKWLKLARRKNYLQVRTTAPAEVRPGQQVEVVGTLVWESGTPMLTEASWRKVEPQIAPPSAVGPRRLQNVSIEQYLAEAQQPSQPYLRGYLDVSGLRGVVTFCDRVFGVNTLFIQDDTAGTKLVWPDTNLVISLRAGQFVDVSGRSVAGHFPVSIEPSAMTVMGWQPMPTPVSYSGDRSTSQSHHARWVEVEGVVRSTGRNGTLNIMGRDGLLSAWVGHTQTRDLSSYINGRVRVHGVLSSLPGNDPLLLVPSPEYLELTERPPVDPFAIPTFAVDDLDGLNMRPDELRQMKVSGVVTYVRPKGLFVQDDTGGALVQTAGVPPVKPGDQVEAVGFPGGRYPVVLSAAQVRKIGTMPMPEAVPIPPSGSDDTRYAGTLARIDATVVEQRNSPARQVLILQAGPRIFEATLAVPADETDRMPTLAPGCQVAVTGVCQFEHNENPAGLAPAATFQMWLRTPADVILLRQAPWWTWEHAAIVFCIFGFGLLSALVWVRMLRRRVVQRTRELRETMSRLEKETHTSAVLAERDRLAGEIHDSLEQGLTAIMLQLDAAARVANNPEEARRYLGMARSMAGFGRAEVQRAVWDLQSPLLENADLGTALQHVASEISAGDSQQVTVEITGDIHPLPSPLEHHLLRIGQEAITNAVKHAQSRTIQVTLHYAEKEFSLTIKDDGQGFVPDTALNAGKDGHFGLQGIRGRAKKINGELAITSRPGEGATIAVTVPLNGGVHTIGSL